MKCFLPALLLSLLSVPVYAQNKNDYNWVLGYDPNIPEQHFGGSLLSFHDGMADTSFFNIHINFSGTIACISDSSGNLVAYTNGCQVQNREHNLMENGDTINPGIVHLQQCNESSGYPGDQNVLFLPQPGSDAQYVLFHLKRMTAGGVLRQLLYSTIDAAANNGLGKVTKKNTLLEQDTFSDMLTAARHANGRDWWLMVMEKYPGIAIPPGAKGKYHRYLLDPQGIHGPEVLQAGKLWTAESYIGQACFSPDGNKYVIVNITNSVHLFDFDRCSGALSNFLHIDLSQDTVWFSGAAFSPDSRLLYVATGLHILQFDLYAADIAASKTIVATYDGGLSPFPTTFFQLMLAPDGKIYGTAPNGVDVMHVIHQPNLPGVACQVESNGLKLPTYHAYTIPNFAHYRLYDLPGSPCDTLGIDGPVVAAPEPPGRQEVNMTLAPNPVSGIVTVGLDGNLPGRIGISDVGGRVWIEMASPAGVRQLPIDTAPLPAGLYIVSFQSDAGRATRKLVVHR